MAEYYAVLSRAVGSLEVNTPETRRAVYDKARNALIGQLKAIVPPLPTSEISRQRLELEEAIRRAEREAANGTSAAPPRPAMRPTVAPPPPPPPEPEPVVEELKVQPQPPQSKDGSPQEVFRRAIREAETRGDAPPPIERAPLREEAYGEPRADYRVADRPPPRRPPPPEEPPYVPPEYRAPRRQEPEPRLAPDFPWEREPQERDSEPPRYAPTPQLDGDDRPARIRDGRRKGGRDRDQRDHDHDRDVGAQFDDGEIRQSRLPVILLLVLIVALVAGLAGLAWWQRGEIAKLFADTGTTKTAATQVAAAPPAPAATPAPDDGKNGDRLLGNTGNAIATTPGVRVVGETGNSGDANTASGNAASAPAADNANPATAPAAQVASAPAAPQPPAQAQPGGDTALVAQKAVLYEEPLDSSKAASGVTQINAAATWSYVNDPTNGPSVVANLDVPDRGLKVKLTIHKNTDKTLPASHMIEVVVSTTPAFPGKGISSIPRLVLKPSEDARGEPLVGATAKVADGFFWIALSALPADTQNNMSLLKGRDWIDLPLVYDTGQRAILTFEKGTPGDRVLAQAMNAWAGG